jgi:predicted HicB family RNase H-like nuclease
MNEPAYQQLIVRVNAEHHRKLRLIAAYENVSMSSLVRDALDDVVKSREKKKAYQELIDAGK